MAGEQHPPPTAHDEPVREFFAAAARYWFSVEYRAVVGFSSSREKFWRLYLERESAMQSISGGETGQRSRRGRQIKTTWTQF
jgi:hypothetical protein